MGSDIELDDYSDIMVIGTLLIGSSENDKIDRKLRIHKLAFLADKIIADSDLDREFDFDASFFGPYSENFDDALKELKNWGIIEPSSNNTEGSKLTEEGRELYYAASAKYKNIHKICKELCDDLKNLSTGEIVKITYRLYPEMTGRSLIKDDLVESKKIDSLVIPINGQNTQSVISENGTSVLVEYNGNDIVIKRGA